MITDLDYILCKTLRCSPSELYQMDDFVVENLREVEKVMLEVE